MKYTPEIHHRRSIRLRNFDYSSANAYFITICTQWGLQLFGEISHGEMNLNDAGTLVNDNWLKLNTTYDNIIIDSHVVMPNHFHGIIWLEETNNIILGQIIGAFKCFTTTAYIKGVRELNWPPFQGRLWQRNFYERIIRNEKELEDSRRYILDNPVKWGDDQYNVHRGDDNDGISGGEPDSEN